MSNWHPPAIITQSLKPNFHWLGDEEHTLQWHTFSLPAFDHLIIACFLSLFSPPTSFYSLDDFTFILSLSLCVAKCSVISLFTVVFCLGLLVTSSLHFASAWWGGTDSPFRCRYHMYIVYLLYSQFTLCCLCFPLVFTTAASMEWECCQWVEGWGTCGAMTHRSSLIVLALCVRRRETCNDG